MELEFASETVKTDEQYTFELLVSKPRDISWPIILDWAPMVKQLLVDSGSGLSLGQLSAKFHNTLVEIMVAMAKHVGEEQVILTGGCFQNKVLTERAIQRLRSERFMPYWHQQIPPNDSGIALVQIITASRQLSGVRPSLDSSIN
jgi:hydrogenase maturation protein HypF